MNAGIYGHYKGGFYKVLGVAEHTETHERVVVYISLTGIDRPGPRMRVRPLFGPEGFMTPVKGENGQETARFWYLGTELAEFPGKS